jgi:hypothetical protein
MQIFSPLQIPNQSVTPNIFVAATTSMGTVSDIVTVVSEFTNEIKPTTTSAMIDISLATRNFNSDASKLFVTQLLARW